MICGLKSFDFYLVGEDQCESESDGTVADPAREAVARVPRMSGHACAGGERRSGGEQGDAGRAGTG